MNYDEAKAYCLQHVMLSQLARPSPMAPIFEGQMMAGRTRYGHGKRRWRDRTVRLNPEGVLK